MTAVTLALALRTVRAERLAESVGSAPGLR
jgi:hypothetical protein